MKIPQFSEAEVTNAKNIPLLRGGSAKLYDCPIKPREAVKMMYMHMAPYEIGSMIDTTTKTFRPWVIPDNIARASMTDATTIPGVSNLDGGKDMFGIDWEYVPTAGGSMVRPGKPFAEDANDLLEKIIWPDIDSWDWEKCRKDNEEYLSDPDLSYCTWMFNGYYERMISLLEFENAIVALIDDEQQDAVHEFLDKLSDLYVNIIDKIITWFPEADVFYFHDDWGSQKASFFSPETGREMIVPYMKKVNDFIHSKGRFVHLHSCGHLMNQVENFIAAGFDAWDPQPMNDTALLYEKYGDQIVIGLYFDDFDPETTTEEEQREMAREFAKKFCKPGKCSMVNLYQVVKPNYTPAFREELYIQSRKLYSGLA